MKSVYLLLVFSLLIVPLIAREMDTEVISVPTGWTAEKAEYLQVWRTFTAEQRAEERANLELRMQDVLPRLPEAEYDHEEGVMTGHRVKLEETYRAFLDNQTPVNYSEFAHALNQAEGFSTYIEREASLPVSNYEEGTLGNTMPMRENRQFESTLQGVGWDHGYVEGTSIDHLTPVIASVGDTVFAALHTVGGSTDTLCIFKSIDGGENWSGWYEYGDGIAARIPFDLAIDYVNGILYCVYYYNDGGNVDIWMRKFTDFSNSAATSIHQIEGTSDQCSQAKLSVEHEYTEHRVCCMYYNITADVIVITRSLDLGETWTTVHTTAWNPTAAWPKPKGCQGATSSYDRFYFVAQKDPNSFVIFESTNTTGWTETEYIHGQNVDAVDISASHNTSYNSVVVAFGYEWNATDFNVRVFFRARDGGAFVSQLVDGDALMTKTPVVSVDGEWAPNHTTPEYYHLSYFKDNNSDSYYWPFALRCANDSAALGDMVHNGPAYFEVVQSTPIDTITTTWDYGTPENFYQIDMTTVYNEANAQWFPAIIWMRWYTSTSDHSPRLSTPDEDYVGVWEEQLIKTGNISLTATPLSSGTVKIAFSIPHKGNISLKAYDASGRAVGTILDGAFEEGRHSHTWNAKLATGQYFLRLRTDRGAETRSVIIMK